MYIRNYLTSILLYTYCFIFILNFFQTKILNFLDFVSCFHRNETVNGGENIDTTERSNMRLKVPKQRGNQNSPLSSKYVGSVPLCNTDEFM